MPPVADAVFVREDSDLAAAELTAHERRYSLHHLFKRLDLDWGAGVKYGQPPLPDKNNRRTWHCS